MNGRSQFSIENERKNEDFIFSRLCLVNFIRKYNVHTEKRAYIKYIGQ